MEVIMRRSVLLSVLFVFALQSGSALADEFELDDKAMEKAPVKELKVTEVKQIESTKELEKAVEAKVEKEDGPFSKGEAVEWLGIGSWAFIVFTIMAWFVLPRKMGIKRMRIHKTLGYCALGLATLHGVVVLFF